MTRLHGGGARRTVLAASLLLASCARPGAAPPLPPTAPRTTTVTLVHLNDVYQISPVDGGRRGGLARAATLVKGIEKEAPGAVFLLAGDFLAPSILSTRFKGAQMVEVLEAAGLDVAAVGNHEFDFGVDVLAQRIAGSRFTWTVSNVFDVHGGPAAGAQHSVILERNGVRIGVFGLLLPETAALARAGQLGFHDPIRSGQLMALHLRERGADLVVALTHLAMVADRRLAAEADVDIVIGGHDHEHMTSITRGRPIVKLDADARELGRVDVSMARDAQGRWRVTNVDLAALPVDAKVPEDPVVAAIVKRYEDELGATLAEVVGETSVVLDARAASNRAGETGLGNLIADAFRDAVGADVALVNSGGIRSDTQYAAGPLTRRDLLSVLPFDNTLVKVAVTGEHLKRLLENGVSLVEHGEGRFPQVSGLSFAFDPGRPAGQRVLEVSVGGKPLDPARRYSLAVSAYVFGGGDGFDFKGAEMLQSDGPLESLVVIEAVKSRGRVAPRVEDRIRAVPGRG